MIHRPGRLGRITSLVVAATARGRGVGKNLLTAAERHLRANGCVKLEVTSGEQRSSAHDFYAANGYKEERVRFTKPSDD
jgi:ribosomal protein S18 acetylase RimI-like enzyme